MRIYSHLHLHPLKLADLFQMRVSCPRADGDLLEVRLVSPHFQALA